MPGTSKSQMVAKTINKKGGTRIPKVKSTRKKLSQRRY